MKARLAELPNHRSSPPHCCIVSGRTDGPVIDFGDPTRKACGPGDPRVYVRAALVEAAARDLLGMVTQAEVDAVQAQLEESEAECRRLAEIVGGGEDLMKAEDRMRAAFGVAPEDETATDPSKE